VRGPRSRRREVARHGTLKFPGAAADNPNSGSGFGPPPRRKVRPVSVNSISGGGGAAVAYAAQQATKDLTNALVAAPVQQSQAIAQKLVGMTVEAATNPETANLGSVIDLLA
jgi:hypothetical protein